MNSVSGWSSKPSRMITAVVVLIILELTSEVMGFATLNKRNVDIGGVGSTAVFGYNIQNVATSKRVAKSSLFMVEDSENSSSKVVLPNDTVGVVGRGFISVLTAKVAAMAGYDTWILYPPGEEETFTSLLQNQDGQMPTGLKLISSSDPDAVVEQLPNTNALIIAADDDQPVDESIINFLLDTEKLSDSNNLKRVVAMSRNLNGKGMGFFVKASKISANAEVWDGSTADQYRSFEKKVQTSAAKCGADYTIVRAGTLKGGGGGENYECENFLSPQYYEMAKKDIVNWQLLFDCSIRGVTLAKGDVMPGPGVKAVFTACGYEASPGDTSRSGIAEAMVQSLSRPNTANIDFGVGTAEARAPPTTEEWTKLFSTF